MTRASITSRECAENGTRHRRHQLYTAGAADAVGTGQVISFISMNSPRSLLKLSSFLRSGECFINAITLWYNLEMSFDSALAQPTDTLFALPSVPHSANISRNFRDDNSINGYINANVVSEIMEGRYLVFNTRYPHHENIIYPEFIDQVIQKN
jgi:hypothetical protein